MLLLRREMVKNKLEVVAEVMLCGLETWGGSNALAGRAAFERRGSQGGSASWLAYEGAG